MATAPAPGILRFLTCGSVDDGKSTLIGRLLFDSRAIQDDALAALETSSRNYGRSDLDFSLCTDGLQAERERRITIDVAYRPFMAGTRRYLLADAPGHEQYTRNMVTAASTADMAVVLIDATRGFRPQTRRHLLLAGLMGLPRVVVAVNKMDLAGWSEPVFREIRRDLGAFAAHTGLRCPDCLPLCALAGDMVVSRGRRLAWYQGPTLLELLEAASPAEPCRDAPFRFPVQLAWPYPDLPGGPLACLGRVESGRVAVGDTILVLPAGRPSRIATIDLHQRMVAEALAGQSVTLRLEPPANLARGDLLAEATVAPCPSRRLEAVVCWFEGKPLASGARLLLQHGTRTVSAEVAEIRGRLDLQDLCQRPAEAMEMNDIGTVILNLRQPICPDPYRRVRNGGAFILMDEATHATVAAGMVQEACLP